MLSRTWEPLSQCCMKGWVGGWTSGWRNGEREERVQVGRWVDRRTEGWMDGQSGSWIDGQLEGKDGWMDGCKQGERKGGRPRMPDEGIHTFLRGGGSHRRSLSRGVTERECCRRHRQMAALGSVWRRVPSWQPLWTLIYQSFPSPAVPSSVFLSSFILTSVLCVFAP